MLNRSPHTETRRFGSTKGIQRRFVKVCATLYAITESRAECCDALVAVDLVQSDGSRTMPTRTRSRHEYPSSAAEWTEYESPLKPSSGFFLDSMGDQSLAS